MQFLRKHIFDSSFFHGVFLVLLLSIFFGMWLGSRPLNVPDEGRYSEVSREMVLSNDFVTPRVNGVVFLDKPPLTYWWQVTAIKNFGVNNWSLRAPSAIFAVIGCLAMFIFGLRLFDRRTGWLAAALLATSPLYFLLAHYIDMNLQIAVWISLTLGLFLLSSQAHHETERKFLLWAAYFAIAGGLLTKGLIALLLPLVVITGWAAILNRWSLFQELEITVGGLIIVGLALPWFIAIQQNNPEFFNYFFITQQFLRFTSTGFNSVAPVWFYLPIILIGFFPWITFFVPQLFALRVAYEGMLDKIQIEIFLLVWIIVILLFFSIPQSKLLGYILPVLPPFALLIGQYVSQYWETVVTKATIFLAVICCITGVALTIFMLQFKQINGFDLSIFHWQGCIVAALFVFIGLLLLTLHKAKLKYSVIALLIFMLALYVVAAQASKKLCISSTLTLIPQIQTHLPAAQVVAYNDFYQDLPVYLQSPKPIITVTTWDDPNLKTQDNALGQLAWGMQYDDKVSAWMLTPAQFWPFWNQGKKYLVLINKQDFAEFKHHSHLPVIILASTPDIVLATNYRM